jgi:hypothetical protein
MAASKRFLLRLDPHLFDALRRWAEDDLRSINAQIEYLLTDQARRAGRLPRQSRKPHRRDTTAPTIVGDSPDLERPLAPTGTPGHKTSEP